MILLKPLQVDDELSPEIAATNAPCDANSNEAKLAVKTGDYGLLENLTVYKDDKVIIKFSDDTWEFKKSSLKNKSIQNLCFSLSKGQGCNVISIGAKKTERLIINQIKAYALSVIYYSAEVIELSSLMARLNSIRLIASTALSYGVSGLECITEEMIADWVADGVDLSQQWAFSGLNALRTSSSFLPFELTLPYLTHKKLNITPAESQQYEVIPFRIWSCMVDTFSKEMLEAYKDREEIQKLTEDMLKAGMEVEKKIIQKIRCGIRNFQKQERGTPSVKSFLAALDDEGIDVVDYEQNDLWLELFYEHEVLLRNVKMGDKTFEFQGRKLTYCEAKDYLSRIWNVCSWLCILLSGMRINELHAMHPKFGAQYIDLPIGNSLRRTERVHLLTTRQSKITLNTQKTDDIYVTTIEGYKAFKVLDALSSPYKQYITDIKSDTLFVDLNRVTAHRQKNKKALGAFMSRFAYECSGIDITLTQADIDNLTVSEGVLAYTVGEQYQITPHQGRRSLAYYLVGYELCSFPALKQQLGHFSMAMTRWYARNATKYSKFWKEVGKLRISEKADICVRIFRRLANGERLAGGKGAAYLQQIQDNPSYFEEGVNKRLLSKAYWVEKLSTGKKHIHAIAPSMYCSNDKCSMRLAIDLTECVDCEFDYIENVAYAESARMNAMYRLERLASEGELNPSVASSCYMTILASERIMKDLDFKYEPYQVPEAVKGLVIDFKVMAS